MHLGIWFISTFYTRYFMCILKVYNGLSSHAPNSLIIILSYL